MLNFKIEGNHAWRKKESQSLTKLYSKLLFLKKCAKFVNVRFVFLSFYRKQLKNEFVFS